LPGQDSWGEFSEEFGKDLRSSGLLPPWVEEIIQKKQKGLSQWVSGINLILEGRPFSFEKHEYLIEPYGDPHPFQVEMKAAQMGLTCKAMLRAIAV